MQQIEVIETTTTATPKPRARKSALDKLAKKARGKRLEPPVHEDPLQELRTLVQEHKALTKKATAIVNMTIDKKNRTTGDPMPSHVPDDVKAVFLNAAKEAKDRASKLESLMSRELKKVPVYTVFLKNVFGLGPVVSAYLVCDIDPRRGEKVSAWKRFCGLAVIDGRLERPRPGEKNHYNKALRTRLFQMMSAMWKNSAKTTAAAPNGQTSKYLDIWVDNWHRGAHDERFDAKANTWADVDCWGAVRGQPRKGGKAILFKRGLWKACGVFVEDLYTVWRALEGLPVWPSYYAAKLGYDHGGKIAVQAPRSITVEEALEIVSDVGSRPAEKVREKLEVDIEEEHE